MQREHIVRVWYNDATCTAYLQIIPSITAARKKKKKIGTKRDEKDMVLPSWLREITQFFFHKFQDNLDVSPGTRTRSSQVNQSQKLKPRCLYICGYMCTRARAHLYEAFKQTFPSYFQSFA